MNTRDDTLPIDARTRTIIQGLPPDDRAQLETLIEAAAAGQRRMLERALNDAVSLVPAPFRKRVQKLFIGNL